MTEPNHKIEGKDRMVRCSHPDHKGPEWRSVTYKTFGLVARGESTGWCLSCTVKQRHIDAGHAKAPQSAFARIPCPYGCGATLTLKKTYLKHLSQLKRQPGCLSCRGKGPAGINGQNFRLAEDGSMQIRCTSKHHIGEPWRVTNRTTWMRVRRGASDGTCRKCEMAKRSVKAAEVRVEPLRQKRLVCAGCGESRQLSAKYVDACARIGLEPMCPSCLGESQVKMSWQKPVADDAPIRWAPRLHRCHTVWEGWKCDRYDDCLTLAMWRGWSGWVCDLPHDMTYSEPVAQIMDDCREALAHILETGGFLPEGEYQRW